MTQLDNPSLPTRVPDPGSRRMALVAAIVAFLGLAAVIYLNQFSGVSSSTARAAKALEAEEAIDPTDPSTIASKMVMKLAYLLDAKDAQSKGMLLAQTKDPSKPTARKTEAERVREAILQAEILSSDGGKDAAETVFREIEKDFGAREESAAGNLNDKDKARMEAARADIATLRHQYAGNEVSAADRERLIGRQDWFAKVALTFGKPNSDPERAALLSGGAWLIVAILFVCIAAAIAGAGGLGCFVALVIMLYRGMIRPRFVPPAPGGSFGWEIVGFFVVAFLCFRFVGWLVIWLLATRDAAGEIQPPHWFPFFVIGGQWVVALAMFYPMLRGVSFGKFRELVGWTAPRGVVREVGAGIFGYMAGLPLLFVVVIITVGLNAWYTHVTGKDEPRTNPILEVVGKGSPALILLLLSLATLWAPLVEETVMRGALYRALRASLPVFVSAIISAIFFGFMHGYPVLLLGPVITIGFIFALMREWRGSIIGPMVAHALNNATVLGLVVVLLYAIR